MYHFDASAAAHLRLKVVLDPLRILTVMGLSEVALKYIGHPVLNPDHYANFLSSPGRCLEQVQKT